jgi:hypothetical protein
MEKRKNRVKEEGEDSKGNSVEFQVDFPEASMASLGEFNVQGVSIASCDEPGSRTSRRSNRAGSVSSKDRYKNLENGVVPYVSGGGEKGFSPNINLRDVIILCQKSYYNVPIFRNTIDLMTEFSLSEIYLTDGNEQSRKFFKIWLKKINAWSIQEQFYREFYRSGNVFFYCFRGNLSRENMMKLSEMFGAEYSIENASGDEEKVPLKYILLNPSDINVLSSSSFTSVDYYKVLNDYEISSLLNPKTEQDKLIVQSIEELKNLKGGKKALRAGGIKIKLDNERLISSFYKKQDYEPLAVPMGFAVLEDINSKLELKKIDRAIAKTIQQAVLLITMGNEKIGLPSPKSISAMRSLFENESVGKVLVSDYTTEAKFVIPEIGNILDPKKYEILDQDIRTGLNNILFGDEKFSNTSVKVKVFFARLQYGREKFLKEFLIPEMEKMGKLLGFKKIPVPKLNDVHLEDNAVMNRVYTQLASIGVLTPEEALEAFESGRLPTSEESEESQRKFKELRDKGYYLPITINSLQEKMGSGDDSNRGNLSTNNGRPVGTSEIKQENTRAPRAMASAGDLYSLSQMKEVLASLAKLEKLVEIKTKEKHSIKRLNSAQKELISNLAHIVARKEKVEDWEDEKVVSSYVDELQTCLAKESAQEEEIDKIAEQHGLALEAATILYHSKKPNNGDTE